MLKLAWDEEGTKHELHNSRAIGITYNFGIYPEHLTTQLCNAPTDDYGVIAIISLWSVQR